MMYGVSRISRLVFFFCLRRVLEQVAEDRDVAEQRHLGDVVDLALLDQAADHDALLVVDDDLRLELALGPRRAELGILAAEVLGLLLDLEADRVVARDVRRDVERQVQLLALDVLTDRAERVRRAAGVAGKPPNDRPALYGMLLPTENSAFSLSIAMMCGADRMFELSWFASAWNSTAYDGMLVPRNVCEFVERRADEAADEAGQRRERRRVRATCSVGVCTPPSTIALPSSTGRPPCELVPMSSAFDELDLEDQRLDEDLAARLVEPPDHVAHREEVAAARHHDQRVRRLVADDADLALERAAEVADRRARAAGRRPRGGWPG